MIRLYCRDKHGQGTLFVPTVEELMAYAKARLASCPFQEAKTPCAKCRVHCYKHVMRDKVRGIMRYSRAAHGPQTPCFSAFALY